MKKFSLLLGALGGALAGYLLSNEKLREHLAKAKSPEDAAKLLGKQLQHDGKKIGTEVNAFLHSEDVRKNVGKVKKLAKKHFEQAKEEISGIIKKKSRAKKS